MGGIVDKAVDMLPQGAQRLIVAAGLGGMMVFSYVNVTGAQEKAQGQIDQLKRDGAHRDDRLDKIEDILSKVANNQAAMQQSITDTKDSVQRIENKVDTLPARIERRHPTD